MSEPRDHLESIDQPTVHHEESDVNIRAIFGFGGGAARRRGRRPPRRLAALQRTSTRRETLGAADHRSPLATDEARLPPEPRLQVSSAARTCGGLRGRRKTRF